MRDYIIFNRDDCTQVIQYTEMNKNVSNSYEQHMAQLVLHNLKSVSNLHCHIYILPVRIKIDWRNDSKDTMIKFGALDDKI